LSYILETDRLRLREFNFDDSPFIIELLNSPGWLKFIGDRNVRTAEQAKNYLEKGPFKSYKAFGYGLSMVERKEDGEPVGMCGILNRDTLEYPDIGFAFLPEHSGKGYAIEIVTALLRYADEKIGLPVLAAIVVPDNTRSIRLLEKTGFVFEKVITLPGSDEQLSFYKRTR
jgi:RimJ/RimL family protein N-acetyltransferase